LKLSIEILRNPESYKKTISNNGKPSAEFGRKFIDGTIVVAEVETAEDGTVAIKSVWKKNARQDSCRWNHLPKPYVRKHCRGFK
jgi:hypothetical protein